MKHTHMDAHIMISPSLMAAMSFSACVPVIKAKIHRGHNPKILELGHVLPEINGCVAGAL